MAVNPESWKKTMLRGSEAAMEPLTPSELAAVARYSQELRSLGESDRDDAPVPTERPTWYDEALAEVADRIQDAVAYVSELGTDGGASAAAIPDQQADWPAYVLSVEEWLWQKTNGNEIPDALKQEYIREHRTQVQQAIEDGRTVAPEALASHPALQRAKHEQDTVDAQKQSDYEAMRDQLQAAIDAKVSGSDAAASDDGLTDVLPVMNLDEDDPSSLASWLRDVVSGKAISPSTSEPPISQPVAEAPSAQPVAPAASSPHPVIHPTPPPSTGLGTAAALPSPATTQSTSDPFVVPSVEWTRPDIQDIVRDLSSNHGKANARAAIMHALRVAPTAYGSSLRQHATAMAGESATLPPIEEESVGLFGADAAMPVGEWQSSLSADQVDAVVEQRQRQFVPTAERPAPPQSDPWSDPHGWVKDDRGKGYSKRTVEAGTDTPISHPERWENTDGAWRRKQRTDTATEVAPESTPASEAAADQKDESAAIQSMRDQFAETRSHLESLREQSGRTGARNLIDSVWQTITGGASGGGGNWIERLLGGASGGGGGGGNNGGSVGGSSRDGEGGGPPDDGDNWFRNLFGDNGGDGGGGQNDQVPWWAPFARPFGRMLQRGGAGFAIGSAQGGAGQGLMSGAASMAFGVPLGVPLGGLASRSAGFVGEMPERLENADKAEVARTAVGGVGALGGAGLAAGVGMAIGGPVGAAAGAVVGAGFEKLVDWTAKLVEGMHTFADRINASNTELGRYNGTIAASQLRLEMGKIQRQFELGEGTSGSAAALADAVNERDQALMQFREDRDNVSNKLAELAANGVEKLGNMYSVLREAAVRAPVIGEAIKAFLEDIEKNTRKDDGALPLAKAVADAVLAKSPQGPPQAQRQERKPINPMWE